MLSTHVIVAPETTKEAASQLKWKLAKQLKNDHFEHLTIEVEFGEADCRIMEKERVAAAEYTQF